MKARNIDPVEVQKFDAIASRWWDANGEFKPLHEINPVRVDYIAHHAELSERRVLDIGCGGGILSEALARRGARVTGIDVATAALDVARLHVLESKVNVEYHQSTAEDFAAQHAGAYDVVTCMEMLEHVPDPLSIVKSCAGLVKAGGLVFFSTLNRTAKAYALAIVGAEYILHMLPKGTHDYRKFIRPSELEVWVRAAGLEFVDIRGISYHVLTQHYALSRDLDVNYLCVARKVD